MKTAMRCYLQIVSPVHIGCDEVYEPMSFVLDEGREQLIAFDSLDFFRALSAAERKTFSDICKKGTVSSLLEIYRFMRSKHHPGYSVAVCPGLVEHYHQTLALSSQDDRSIQRDLNRFTISRTAFDPVNKKPYLPGSSIKGALRTAYLNRQAGSRKVRTPSGRNAARELETMLLDRDRDDLVGSDPFRMLKVSDFLPVGTAKTKILYAVNRKKNPSKFDAQGVYQMLEIVEPGSVFVGSISAATPENGSGIRSPVSLEILLNSANGFYGKEMARENHDLKGLGVEPPHVRRSEPALFVRLGRHSGAECLTIEGHRDIRIKQGKGQDPKSAKLATTLWLAAESRKPKSNQGLKPFGWACIEAMTEKEFAEMWRSAGERLAAERPSKEFHSEAFESADEKIASSALPSKVPPIAAPVSVETWADAHLSWNPGNQMVTAAWQNKRATGKGKELVPGCFHERLFAKKKAVIADVDVEPVGNAYKIVEIKPEN